MIHLETATAREPPENADGEVRRRPLLARGTSIGRFVILSPVGGGGMGTVYAAYDPTLDRKVAIKLLHLRDGHDEDSEPRARLVREAQAMARIAHPNVVTIFDVGVTEDRDVFLAMEIVEGGTVADWLDARPRNWREVLRLFCEAGEGLAAAHRAGIIHRDFKLDNVVVGADGKPRVTDFGLARAATKEDRAPADPKPPLDGGVALPSPSGSLSNPLTETGAFLGTPGYMAPEQYGVSEGIDHRADVFAFCAALYRALYGERPFVGETVEQVAFSTVNGKIREAPPDSTVPQWLRRALLRGLATDPAQRFSSMEELLAALRDDPGRRRARRLAWAVGALAAAGVLVGWRIGSRPAAAAPACPADPSALAGVWDPPRKTAVQQAFAATGRSYAGDTWQAVAHTLDDYAARWQAARKDACEATRVRGEQSQAMFELRTACLDDRRQELRALVDVLGTADGASVEKAAEAVNGLSPIDACADVDRLSAAARLPTDPAARAEIAQLGNELASAKALSAAGRRLAAIDRLRAIRPRVEETGYGPLLYSWSYRLATSEERTDQNAAVSDYERCIAIAEAHRLDPEKARAEIDLASLEGGWLGRSADAHRWMVLARATIARMNGDAQLEASSDVEEGWVYEYEHKIADAGRLFGQVISRPDFDRLPAQMRASAYSGMAEALGAEGKSDDAVHDDELALGVMEETLGARHPQLVGYINNLAVAQLEAGRVDEALASASRALQMLEDQARRGDIAASSPDLGLAAHTLGEVLLRAHRPADAVAQLLRARASYRESQGADNADVAFADNELAEGWREIEHPDDARRALVEASAIEKKTSDVPPAVVAGTLAGLARLELDRDRPAAALPLAKRAFTALGEADGTPRERAGVLLVLSDALRRSHAELAQSRALAEKARDLFTRAHDDDRVHACDVVLASLR